MKERVFSFGSNKGLYGIVCDPGQPNPDLPAFIILNSGLIPRFGPNRLSVQMARRLAQHGFTSLRFDFSGIGDSRLRDDFLPFEESGLLETAEAMDFLAKARSSSRFILTGVCSGADTSFGVALSDPRVCGIIPVDFYGVASVGYQLKIYRRRLAMPRSWVNLATGRSDIWAMMSKLPQRLRTASKDAAANAANAANADKFDSHSAENVSTSLQNLCAAGMPIHLIYSSGSPAYYNYETTFKKGMHEYLRNGLLSVTYFNDADHGFTLRYIQKRYLDTISSWVCKTFAEVPQNA